MSQNGKSHICPIDKRQFATKKALAQHRAASHSIDSSTTRGNGSRRPRNAGGNKLRSQDVSSGRSLSGIDIIGTFLINAVASAGAVVMGGPLSPNFLEGTRIHQMSTLWGRWRPKKLRVEFISSAGAMTSGSLVAGWNINPDLWLKDDVTSISSVAAMKPSSQMHISKRFSINIPCTLTRAWYLLDKKADIVDQAHGKYFAVLAASIGNVTGSSTFTYTVRLHYTIEFESPTLPMAAEVLINSVYVNAGYESYFTDSDSGWEAGKKLTLKHAAGGSMAEFDNLQDGAIYELDPSANLIFYKANGVKARIKYMVKIFSQAKHVAVFETLSQARMYVSRKDSKYIPDYEKTGDAVVPSNPAWVMIEQPSHLTTNEVLSQRIADLELSLRTLMTSVSVPSSSLGVSDAGLRQTAEIGLRYQGRSLTALSSFEQRFKSVSEVDPLTNSGVVNVAGLLDEEGTPDQVESRSASGWDMGA